MGRVLDFLRDLAAMVLDLGRDVIVLIALAVLILGWN